MKRAFQILIVFLVLVSCDNYSENDLKNFGFSDAKMNMIAEETESLDETIITGSSNQKKEANYTDRKLIKNGHISFETDDLQQTKQQIISLIKKYGGYIAADNQNAYGNTKTINLSVRIPAQHFDTILSGIAKNVEKFDNKEIRISDVTAEFLDVEARLKNKKELDKKYLEILQKAKSVQDILNVERELGKLREEIESTEGRLKYLKNQVAFSTLNISFYKSVKSTTSFGKRIAEGFVKGFENLKGFFIGIINLWPFVLILLAVIILIRKRFKRKK